MPPTSKKTPVISGLRTSPFSFDWKHKVFIKQQNISQKEQMIEERKRVQSFNVKPTLYFITKPSEGQNVLGCSHLPLQLSGRK